MIVKTLSHHHYNFKRLIDYIYEDRGRHDPELSFDLCHNLRGVERNEVIREFYDNARCRPPRKNGVTLYHDILSFSPEDRKNLSLDKLYDLSLKYVELRGAKGLCFAKPHLHQDHLHVHFCFSGNQYQSDKALRLDKYEFKQIRQDLEHYQIRKYPEIEHSRVYLDKSRKHQRNQILEQKYQEPPNSKNMKQPKQKTMNLSVEDTFEKLSKGKTVEYFGTDGRKLFATYKVNPKAYNLKSIQIKDETGRVLSNRITGKQTLKNFSIGLDHSENQPPTKEKVQEIFDKAKGWNDFVKRMEQEEIKVESVGNQDVFKLSNRTYELGALGITSAHKRTLIRLDELATLTAKRKEQELKYRG